MSRFESIFGHAPQVSAEAPGRVNLIGEHIDYNGGTVLPAALKQKVRVELALRDDALVSISSSSSEGVVERGIDEPATGHWTDYTLGALAKAREQGWNSGGAKVAIESDIPEGAGVSSSAALVTAILRAAASLGKVEPSPEQVALHAQAVEVDYIGMPCGIMDQMAVGVADVGHAIALNTASLAYEVVAIPSDWEFRVIHSGIHRKLTDGRYKARFEECKAAKAALGTDGICHLDEAQLAAAKTLPDNLAKRVAHTMSEHARTLQAVDAMRAGEAERFGDLMNESHRSYSLDFEASTPEIDRLVGAARTLGAQGARLTGGGFGGCIVALLKKGEADAWSEALLRQYPDAWSVTQ